MSQATIEGTNRHYAAIVGCAAAFTAVSVITLAMRVMSKVVTRAPFGWEDYTIGLAVAVFIVTEGLMVKGITVGRHSKELNDPASMYMSEMVYIYSIFYFVVVALAIASILLLYRRVFIKPFIKHATTFLLVFTALWFIPCLIIEVAYFGTPPVTFNGAPKDPNPFHVNYLQFWLPVGIIEQVIIIVAIMLPVREIYLLHLDLHKRLSMMLIFAVSYICVGTGIARLVTIYHPDKTNFDISIGNIWVSAHLGTAIMSANLPVCWPIVMRIKRMLGMKMQPEEKWEKKVPGIEEARGYGPGSSQTDRLDSGTGSVLEAAMVGPTTKDGYVRNESMAHDMGSDTTKVSPSSSDAGLIAPMKENGINEKHQDRKPGRWLQLKPFNWRMSFSGSMFASQASRRG